MSFKTSTYKILIRTRGLHWRPSQALMSAMSRYNVLGKEKKLLKTECVSSAVSSSLCDTFAFCYCFSSPLPPLTPLFLLCFNNSALTAQNSMLCWPKSSVPCAVLTCCRFSALFFSSVVVHAPQQKATPGYCTYFSLYGTTCRRTNIIQKAI